MRNLGIVLACGIVGAGSLRADLPGDDKIRMVLRWADPARMAGSRIDDTLPVIVAFMRANDIDGVPGLSYDDAKMRVRMDNASRGLEPLQRVLASDLDGNLEVSRAEAETVASIAASRPLQSAAGLVQPDQYQRAALTRRLADGVMEADRDGDNVVSESEIRALAAHPAEDKENSQKRLASQEAARIIAWADANGDGTATLDEITVNVRGVLDLIDSDDDGRITRAELQAVK